MFLTRGPCGAKPQVKGAQGPIGRPNPMAGRPHFELVRAGTWWLCSHINLEEDHMPRVGGNWEEWLAGHMNGRPAIHHI
jgi:hypothetical protein